MSVYAGPNTTQSGLVLHIDPSNPRCYPGSGSTLFDLSGGGNNGTLTNGASVITNGAGRAVNFDGVDDYVNCGDPAFFSGASQISISIWVYPRQARQFAGIATKDPHTNGNNRFGIFTGFSGTDISVNCGTGNTYGYGGTMTLNSWNNLMLVFDGTQTGNANRIKGYINGRQVSLTFSGPIPSITPTNTANFGMMTPMDGGTFFNAQGDDLRVYSRALSASEILNNFNATRGRYGI